MSKAALTKDTVVDESETRGAPEPRAPHAELLLECAKFIENCSSYDGADTDNLHTRIVDALAAQPVEPPDCRDCDRLLAERDYAKSMCNALAELIACITKTEIGEHSSGNFPWDNAREAAEDFLAAEQPKPAHEPRAAQESDHLSSPAFLRQMADEMADRATSTGRVADAFYMALYNLLIAGEDVQVSEADITDDPRMTIMARPKHLREFNRRMSEAWKVIRTPVDTLGRPGETPDAQCLWESDGSYSYNTSCGNQYTFGEASEQDMFAFCPFCGEQPVTTDKGAATPIADCPHCDGFLLDERTGVVHSPKCPVLADKGAAQS